MGMLDGVYILSDDGKCLLSFPINGAAVPPFQFGSYVAAASRSSDKAQTFEVTAKQLLHLLKHNSLYFFVPFESTVVPLLVEQLSLRLVEVLELYLKSRLTPIVVNEHRPEIILILSEMFDMGFPRIAEPNIINQLVYKDDFLTKLMSNANLASSHSAVGAASQGKTPGTGNISGQEIPDALVPWEVPWRRSQVKHAKEELFVDIIEHAKLVVGAKSKSRSSHAFASSSPVVSSRASRVQLHGEIKLLSRLSGLPQVTISLPNEGSAVSPRHTQLHPCVDLDKFEASNGRTLTFVPADGESVIANYRVVAKEAGPVAAELRRFDSAEGDGSFQVRLSTSIDAKVEHVSGLVAYVFFPPGAKLIKELSTTSGDFSVSNPQRCELRFQKTVPMGWNAMLHALATDEDGKPVSPLCIDVRYSLLGRVPSRTTVKSIYITPQKLRAQGAAPFKGVRYQTVMDSYVVA